MDEQAKKALAEFGRKMDLRKEEFHDLLNGEAMDGWAIFAVKIAD